MFSLSARIASRLFSKESSNGFHFFFFFLLFEMFFGVSKKLISSNDLDLMLVEILDGSVADCEEELSTVVFSSSCT